MKGAANVAFLGDSLTRGWFYPHDNYGIFGNNSAQILKRSSAVLRTHKYKTLILLGGTNDVLQHVNPAVTIKNLRTIGETAQEAGIEPVLCEIPPIFHSWMKEDKSDYTSNVLALNKQIVTLANEHHWKLVDYYDPIAGHPEYTSDGVHMKRRGYWAMEQALVQAMPSS